jgi:hypothetical protein
MEYVYRVSTNDIETPESLLQRAIADGRRNHGMYVRDTKIPEYLWRANFRTQKAYLDNLFLYNNTGKEWGPWCMVYATNRSFMEELVKFLTYLGYKSYIYPYRNCECEFGITLTP